MRSWKDHQCLGKSRTCDQQQEGNPEFTWSIVAAGDKKSEKKAGSPQGWEEVACDCSTLLLPQADERGRLSPSVLWVKIEWHELELGADWQEEILQ
ncbi:hypothetical protein NQZ68_017524 [Dissostichus eleginoides]|nr:hypothetical protein NQZ68_017524 [Dissostichus eleginoides]